MTEQAPAQPTFTPEQQAEMKKRTEDCNKELLAALEKYNCTLKPQILLEGGNHPISVVAVVSK